jgi:hypothetical protein
MTRGLLAIAIALFHVGCKKTSEERPREAGSAGSAGSAAAAPPPGAHPDWPCSTHTASGGPGGTYRFRYDGPSACTTTPDLVIVGCPTLEELDDGDDGIIDRWRTFHYDANGRLVGVDYRRAQDGPVTTRLAMQYAADGSPVRSDIDNDADGTIEASNVYGREDGKLVRRFDRDADGKPDLIATSSFDDRGRVVETTIDHGAAGKVAATATYRWDGDRLAEEVTAMGELQIATTYRYDCAP